MGLAALLFCAALAVASPAADAQGGSCRACDENPDRCIDACTLLIDGGLRDAGTLSKAFKNRGDAHARKGALDAAAADYGRAMTLTPGDAAAVNNRGIVFNRQGRFDAAISDFSRAIALEPGRAAFRINRARAHHGKKDYTAAVADLDHAIALNPEDPRALNNRAGALMMLGRHDAAIRDLDRAIALDPDYPVAFNNRGIARAGQGDFTAAIRDYDRALALRPDYAKARENRQQAVRKQRQAPAETLDLPPPEPAMEQVPALLAGAPNRSRRRNPIPNRRGLPHPPPPRRRQPWRKCPQPPYPHLHPACRWRRHRPRHRRHLPHLRRPLWRRQAHPCWTVSSPWKTPCAPPTPRPSCVIKCVCVKRATMPGPPTAGSAVPCCRQSRPAWKQVAHSRKQPRPRARVVTNLCLANPRICPESRRVFPVGLSSFCTVEFCTTRHSIAAISHLWE